MVEVGLGVATALEDGVTDWFGHPRYHHPKRLTTGVGVDDGHPLPSAGWLPDEGSGEVQGRGGLGKGRHALLASVA